MSPKALELQGFHTKMRDLIGVAVDLGWNATQAGHASRSTASVVLHSFDGTQTVRVTPVRQVNEAKLRTMRNKIIKYADPIKRLNAVAQIGWSDEHPHAHSNRLGDAELPHLAEAILTGTVTVPERHVVVERPWLARKAASKAGGTVYESAAAIERTWSDGAVDYACAFHGCEFTNVKARSVANHFGQAHTAKGETQPRPQEPLHPAGNYFEPLSHRPYNPTDRLVSALADFLLSNTEQGASLEELARSMLTWAHERPDLPDVVGSDSEPLTPEQILERVRMLVGAPIASRLAEAEERVAGLVAQVAEQEAVVMAREAVIEHLREERRALAGLLLEEDE
jgi:hypothetical protein